MLPRTRFYMEQGHLVRERKQNVAPILAETKRRRDERSAIDMEGLGRPALTIPEVVYERLIRENPDLDPRKADTETQTRAWKKYMQHPDSKPWRNFDRI